MFELIHEFAVAGTAALMVALHSIWYHPQVAGRLVALPVLKPTAAHTLVQFRVRQWLVFLVMEVVLAVLLIAVAQLSVLVWQLGMVLVLVWGLTRSLLVLEMRTDPRSFLADFGFAVVFITCSLGLLYYWPW